MSIFKYLDSLASRNLLAHGRYLTRGATERSAKAAARDGDRRKPANSAAARRNTGATPARA